MIPFPPFPLLPACRHGRVTGPLPPSWSSLVNLKELDLTDNNVTGGVTVSWTPLAPTVKLYFNMNPLM